MDLLQNKYPLAKDSLIELEAQDRIKALGAFTDLRDVFDHLYLAIKYACDDINSVEKEKLVNENLSSANEHLRRAAIEPLETAIEDLLAKIVEKGKYNYILYPIRISKVSNDEIRQVLIDASKDLVEIRKMKGQINKLEPTVKILQKQHEILISFEKKCPTKITAKILFGITVAFLIGLFIGIII